MSCEQEILNYAVYDGGNGLGWTDRIAGGVSNSMATTKEAYVADVIAYFDKIPQNCDEQILLLKDEMEGDLGSARFNDYVIEINKYKTRARSCNRHLLQELAEKDWGELISNR